MLSTGSLVTAATAARVGAAWLELMAQHTPPLVALAVRGSLPGERSAVSQSEFRDRVLGLARDSAERSWRELRRGVDELDAWTRPSEVDAADPVPRRRPYRVKP